MKLAPLTIIILGIAVALVALGVGLREFLPDMKEAQFQREYTDALKIEANKQQAANKRVERAVATVKQMGREWQQTVAVKTPPQDVSAGGINLAVNRWQLVNDTFTFRNNIQRAVNSQVKRGGVKILQGPSVPPPSSSATQVVETFFNYPAIKFPVCIFDLGQVTVEGTYGQIVENVRAWRDMPNYLAVANGLSITGTSPTLRGTYAVTVVAYIRGDKVSASVPEIAGAPDAGGFGGGGGGGGGGGRPATGGAPAGGGPPSAPIATGNAGG